MPPATERVRLRLLLVRVLVLVTVALGANYLVWRWLVSVNWSAWPIAVPLVLAETWSFVDTCLFGLTMWRLRQRGPAPPPRDGATVDVFVTTHDEPVDLVMETALAARGIDWRHATWVLDDGDRDELRLAAENAGIGYLSSSESAGGPRHPGTGSLNHALVTTGGEFLLVLGADQVPSPDILHRTLGWFRDESVALVQTPQWSPDVAGDDVLRSRKPLFFGPVQRGRDGWNAASFCGSNALLRREAVMQIGVAGYVREKDRAVRDGLRSAGPVLASARRAARRQGPQSVAAVRTVQKAVEAARRDLKADVPATAVAYTFEQSASRASRDLEQLTPRESTPLDALDSVRAMVGGRDAAYLEEAGPRVPMATISTTDDTATAMRLHSAGWRTVCHGEVLAHGSAAKDAVSMLHQRLRWAQDTLRALLQDSPLVRRGLTAGQRVMHLATLWSYLSGFAAIAYIAAPISYLVLGVLPVTTLGTDFLVRLVPFLLANQVLLGVIGWRLRAGRGQQHDLALFPLWIRACTTAAGNVWFRRPLRSQTPGARGRVVRVQLLAIGALLAAVVVGVVKWSQRSLDGLPTAVSLVWIAYELALLATVVRFVLRGGPQKAPKAAKAPKQSKAPKESMAFRESKVLMAPKVLKAAKAAKVPKALKAPKVLKVLKAAKPPKAPKQSKALGSRLRGVLAPALAVLALLLLTATAGVLLVRGRDDGGTSASGPQPGASATSRASGQDAASPTPTTSPNPTSVRIGSYVRSRITGSGDVRVEQWIHARRPLSRLQLDLRTIGDAGARATDLQVLADGAAVDAPKEVGRSVQTVTLDTPARKVLLRYTLRGVVERSPDVPGRALVRAVALNVDQRPRPLNVTITGPEVLSLACFTPDSPVPRPCGAPVKDSWRVRMDSPGQAPSLQAQVNLS